MLAFPPAEQRRLGSGNLVSLVTESWRHGSRPTRQAIRRLANRLATIEELSADQLSLLEADDIEFSDVPAEVFASETDGAARVHVACPSCDHANDVPGGYLGRQLQCPKCKKGFTAEWGELVE